MKTKNGKPLKNYLLEQVAANCSNFSVRYSLYDNPNSPTKIRFDESDSENTRWFFKNKFAHGVIDSGSVDSQIYMGLNNDNIGFSGIKLYFDTSEELIAVELLSCADVFYKTVERLGTLYGIPFKEVHPIQHERKHYTFYF